MLRTANLEFPFGMSLKPIQVRSVVILTRCAPTASMIAILRVNDITASAVCPVHLSVLQKLHFSARRFFPRLVTDEGDFLWRRLMKPRSPATGHVRDRRILDEQLSPRPNVGRLFGSSGRNRPGATDNQTCCTSRLDEITSR
jgi:hypothetical protein